MEITLLEDPACPWCWAFQPVVTALEFEFPRTAARRSLQIRRVMGGASDRPVVEGSFVARQWSRAAAITGMPFRAEVWDRHLLRTTFEACRTVKAANPQGGAAAARILRRIREAFFTEGAAIDDRETLLGLARGLGLDAEALAENLSNGRADLLFQRDRQEASGCRFGFPTILARKHSSDAPAVLHGVVPYVEVLQTLYRLGLSPRERRRFTGEAGDWDRLFSMYPRLAPSEVALITGSRGEGFCRQEGDFLVRDASAGIKPGTAAEVPSTPQPESQPQPLSV
jgi:putative protein-disulfide isomerase